MDYEKEFKIVNEIKEKIDKEIVRILNEEYRLVMLTSPICPACKSMKEALGDSMGEIEEVNIESDTGKWLANEMNVQSIPALFVVRNNFKRILKCSWTDTGDSIDVQVE